VPLAATVTGVPGEHGVKRQTGPEGEIERPGVDKRRAAEAVAVGAGVGTLAGAAAGGGKGAAIGAAAGAGVGLGAGILTDRNFRLEKGTQLEVQLDRQLIVPH
jgi:outer membrane lipoprotein SlyB